MISGSHLLALAPVGKADAEGAVAQRPRLGHPHPLAVEARPEPACGGEHLAAAGVEDDPHRRAPPDHAGDGHAPGADAVEEAPGAVDRIHHPDRVAPPFRQTLFLAQHRILGQERREPGADQALHLAIGGAHHVLQALALHRQGFELAEATEGEGAGFAGDGFGDGEAGGERGRGHDGSGGLRGVLSMGASPAAVEPPARRVCRWRRLCEEGAARTAAGCSSVSPDKAVPVKGRLSLDAYCRGVLAGDRGVLSRAITLIESRRADDRERAEALLNALLPHAGRARR